MLFIVTFFFGAIFIISVSAEEQKFIRQKKEQKIRHLKMVARTKKQRAEQARIKKEQKKLRKEEQQKEDKKQEKLGNIKYECVWMTPEKAKREKEVDTLVRNAKRKNEFKGFFVKCNSCRYIWKVKKDYGLPHKCGKCNSEYISIEKYKTFDQFYKVK